MIRVYVVDDNEKDCERLIQYLRRYENENSPGMDIRVFRDGEDVVILAGAGTHKFAYEPSAAYRKTYSLDPPWEDLKKNPKTWEILQREYPYAGHFMSSDQYRYSTFVQTSPFFYIEPNIY